MLPEVQPGYLRKLLPSEGPLKGENWDAIMADIDSAIMPGVSDADASHTSSYYTAAPTFVSCSTADRSATMIFYITIVQVEGTYDF